MLAERLPWASDQKVQIQLIQALPSDFFLREEFCSIFSLLTQVYKHPKRSGSLEE